MYLGKTVVIGEFITADEEFGTWKIEGKEFKIKAIEGNENFQSPLERRDEVDYKRTMSEFLCHPKKSKRRKFKKGDYGILTLQRHLDKKNNTIFYELQNATIFNRKLNIEDDIEYKGFVLKFDDISRFYKDDENLPLFLLKLSSNKESKEEIINKVELLLKEGISNRINFNYKDEDNNYITKIVVLDKNKEKDNVSDIENLIDFEDFKNTINQKEENFNFNITLFKSGTKTKPVIENTKKTFLNNVKTKKPRTEIEKLINEDIEAFYSKNIITLDNNNNFVSKEIYGKEVNGNFLYSPVVVSFKQSYNINDESFYVINSIVPDVIELRKRALNYLKKEVNNEEKQNHG